MFKAKNSLSQKDSKLIKKFVIANSAVLTKGDACSIDADGFLIPATASTVIAGIVNDIVNERGTPVVTNGGTGSYMGTYTVASDNETVGKVMAQVNLSSEAVYSAELDAAVGSTAGSDEISTKFDLVSASVIDESDVTGTQFISLGLDPDNAARILVKILNPLF